MTRWLGPTLALALSPLMAMAEEADYGSVWLTGLARENWPLNPGGVMPAMVCNVNGPDGFLSIRSGPGTNHTVQRKLSRLAIVEVDTRERVGRWIAVQTAYRDTSPVGVDLPKRKSLHVVGWAHDGYLCAFVH